MCVSAERGKMETESTLVRASLSEERLEWYCSQMA